MLGFNDSSDNILYGLQHEEHSAAAASTATCTPSPTSTSVAATPEASPDLLPACASASQSRSSSFSLSRSSSFSVPALSATASPSLAEVFLRGPSTEKAALQQYLMGLADTTSTSSTSTSGSGKRKRRSESDKKKSRKTRRTAAAKKTTAERANAKAQRANATATPTEAITTASLPTTTTTPVEASPAVPYSSPSLYFSSMPSPCSSFSSYTAAAATGAGVGYHTPISTPTLPSTPGAAYYYPNVLFDAPSPAAVPTTYLNPAQQAFQPQYEDDDFWLEVEAVMPTRAHHQHQLQCFEQAPPQPAFNSSFCELERFLLENDF